MTFNSAREINKACLDAGGAKLGGKCVYAKKYVVREIPLNATASQIVEIRQHNATRREFDFVRISQARTQRGDLQVRHGSVWFSCCWSDVVIR